MGQVFILGAGASHFAGYPLGLDLWSFIRKFKTKDAVMAETLKRVVSQLDDTIESLLSEEHGNNLELVFTLFDLASSGIGPLVLEKINWRALKPDVMALISECFLSREIDFQQQLAANSNSDQNEILERWAELIAPGDTVITFNWDILHESALWRAQKWHHADGYGFRHADARSDEHSPIKILKLHGSVNWVQESKLDCRPAVVYKGTFFRSATDRHSIYAKEIGQSNNGRNLIIPTYLKDIGDNKLLLQLWKQASEALATATKVTVIGFQANPADALARQVLALGLLANKHVAEIWVVAPKEPGNYWDSPDAKTSPWESFCSVLGKGYMPINKRFEDWVKESR